MGSINELTKLVNNYLETEQIDQIRLAYEFSRKAHEGQSRASGEPYINHPLEVAFILGGMRLDHQTLIAAILHDVIEDTAISKSDIERKFGRDVAMLVDGVSKLDSIQFASKAEAQSENFCKMLMAMSRDIRVILVKLADRLHNMRTLSALNRKKQQRIARETLDIYVPMASRLGMNTIRIELEDLGFRVLHPYRYSVLSRRMARLEQGTHKKMVRRICKTIERRMRQLKINTQISGRKKHVYSIYRKMQAKNLSFEEIDDIHAFRVIVDEVDTCYRALGIIHSLYRPVPGKFKDYIAIPKTNGYQSLHSILFGPSGAPIEVQIRTETMNDVAEIGLAAHWRYKSGITSNAYDAHVHQRAREWIQDLLVMNQAASNPDDFFDNIKIDLISDEVYVFTPRGDIIALPIGATVVDFAYAIHTDIGNSCTAGRINNKSVPLDSILGNGDTVDVTTTKSASPNPAWLNFVATVRARSQIRHVLKTLKADKATSLGKRLLANELKKSGLYHLMSDPQRIKFIVEKTNVTGIEQLFQDIGLGNKMAPLVARQWLEKKDSDVESPLKHPLVIKGTEGIVVVFPKCCYPLPGDPIFGVLSSGRGVVIHQQRCRNYYQVQDNLVHVKWDNDVTRLFDSKISMQVRNQSGVLAMIAAVIAEMGVNIDHIDMHDRDEQYITLEFVIQIHHRLELAKVIKRLRHINSLIHIKRVATLWRA